MEPSRSAWVAGATKRPSEIWISAEPSAGSRAAQASAVRTWPPLAATISPRAIARFAKRPLPWIGLDRTSVFGERKVRSVTSAAGERIVEDEAPGPVRLPPDHLEGLAAGLDRLAVGPLPRHVPVVVHHREIATGRDDLHDLAAHPGRDRHQASQDLADLGVAPGQAAVSPDQAARGLVERHQRVQIARVDGLHEEMVAALRARRRRRHRVPGAT